jgi:primosomal replication protein N
VNKVFLTGRLKTRPEVAYTPKGGRILTFPLWIEEDGFAIDVIYLDRQGTSDLAGMTGATVMVSGTLTKPKDRVETLRLKAHKIIRMED